MSATFYWKKEPPKKKHTHKFLMLLKGRYYLMGGHIDINVGVF